MTPIRAKLDLLAPLEATHGQDARGTHGRDARATCTRPRGAFTLLEVILAISLALGIVGSLLGFYNYVARIRGTIMDDVQMASSQRLVMERLTDEIRGAMVYSSLGMGLQGQADRLNFITARVPGPAVWVKPDITEQSYPPEQDIQLVSYRLRIPTDEQGRPLTDDQGNIIVEGLERTCQKLMSAMAQEGKEISVGLLTPYMKFLSLRYWDGANWTEGWAGGDLPLAVEITLGRQPLPQGFTPDTYPYDVQRRLIYVPGGRKALGATTAILGLDSSGGAP